MERLVVIRLNKPSRVRVCTDWPLTGLALGHDSHHAPEGDADGPSGLVAARRTELALKGICRAPGCRSKRQEDETCSAKHHPLSASLTEIEPIGVSVEVTK